MESVEGSGRRWEAAHEREQHAPHVCEHLFLGLVRERKKGGARIPKPRARGGGSRGRKREEEVLLLRPLWEGELYPIA